MSLIMIGWAEEDLTPKKRTALSGQFYERISQYVHTPVTATACAIEADADAAILVSVDIVSLEQFTIERIRRRFSELCPEVPAEKLIIFATHTHTSLDIRSGVAKKNGPGSSTVREVLSEFFPDGKLYTPMVTADDTVITPQAAEALVVEKVAQAAQRAWQSRQQAYYANEFGRAAVGMCRRVTYDDGSGQMWGDTNTANFVSLEGGNDSGIELLYTFDKTKKLTGVWANVACPAQILEQRSFVSADYWGEVKSIIRKELGKDIYLLGMCGAAGDQCPRDLVRWVQPETPIDDPNVKREYPLKRRADPSMYDISGCQRVGKRIANEIIAVWEQITEYHAQAVFSHETVHINLPLRKATMAQYNDALRQIAYYIERNKNKPQFDFADTARMHVYGGLIKRYREQQQTEVVPVEYHVLRLGDICVVTNPFELFLDYGNRIKARSFAQQTFIAQLCCGSRGYLPTQKAEQAGHYSAYISSGQVGSEGGDLLVRDTLHRINKLFTQE